MASITEGASTPRYHTVLGRAAEIARAAASPDVRAEHLFLAIIRERQAAPAQVLARLTDLDTVESAILGVMNSPGYRGVPGSADPDRIFLPEDQELDGPLCEAIIACLPDRASFSFNWENGRPWVHVTEPGSTRDVLRAALARLGRPGLN